MGLSPLLAQSALDAAEPKSTIIIEARKRLLDVELAEIWRYRELLYFLTWRDIKVRYKQTWVGAAWALVQPLTTMVIFTAVFGNFAQIPSDGVPYPIFAYTALLPWTFFATTLNRCTLSVVGDSHLLTKAYFPRLITPLAASLSGFVDFAVAFIVLLGMMAWFGIAPTWRLLTLPLFLLLALLAALALGLSLSTLYVRYRDVGHAIPLALQFWMYISPVAYPASLVPERWRPFYALNPMVEVIEGFRWALLGTASPSFVATAASMVILFVLLVAGLLYFKSTERSFADVI